MQKPEQPAQPTSATSTAETPPESLLSSAVDWVLEIAEEDKDTGFALGRTLRGWAVVYKPRLHHSASLVSQPTPARAEAEAWYRRLLRQVKTPLYLRGIRKGKKNDSLDKDTLLQPSSQLPRLSERSDCED